MAKTKKKLVKKAVKKAKKSAKPAKKSTVKKKAAKKPAQKMVIDRPARKPKSPAFQNPFVWYDIMTNDLEGAKKFYGQVIGWTFTQQSEDYTVCNVNNIGIGGIMKMPPHITGMPPFWSGYIYTPNVDKACADIKSAGGKIHREPWDIPGVIRMAVVSDPTGVMFNIMQPLTNESMPRLKEGTQGTIGWHELHTNDLQAAWKFYSKHFGWTQNGVFKMGGAFGDYIIYALGGKDNGGMMKRHDQMPAACWIYYFNVDAIDAAVARVTAAGGKVVMGPHQVPGGSWIIGAMDPQGGYFSLMSKVR